MKNLRSGQNNIAGNHHKPGAGEWWFSFLVKVLNFLAWDVLNIMRKVEYEKLNRNRIDFENGIWYLKSNRYPEWVDLEMVLRAERDKLLNE